jgi:hypothetical protein
MPHARLCPGPLQPQMRRELPKIGDALAPSEDFSRILERPGLLGYTPRPREGAAAFRPTYI